VGRVRSMSALRPLRSSSRLGRRPRSGHAPTSLCRPGWVWWKAAIASGTDLPDCCGMRTRIKVCGIASADEARLAVEAGVDALGFNCVGPSSPRTVEDSTVAEITKLTPPPVATFLLTVEQTADAIADHVRRTHPTTV
jgi:hypothetical protein